MRPSPPMIREPRAARAAILCATLIAATSNAAAYAQEAPSAEERGAVSLRLSGETELAKLVELVSERLGVSVQYQAQDLANKRVTLRLREALSDDELWLVLTSALEAQGLVIAPTDAPSVHRVATLQQAVAQGLAPGSAPGTALRPGVASLVSTIVRVRHLDASRAAEALKPLLSQQAVVRAVADGTNLLLLADSRARVEQALAMLELIDHPPEAPMLPGADALVRRVVALEHLSAAQAADLAQRVLGAERAALMSNPSSSTGIAARATLSVASSGSASATGFIEAAPGVQLVALPGENRLLILASNAANADRVEALLRELDVPLPFETRSYAPPAPGVRAADLATTLRELLSMQGAMNSSASSSASGGAGAGAGGGGTSGGGAGGRVWADALTGSVFVTGTARDHARVEALLAQLRDAPPGSLRELRSFVIRNRDASDLLATLESLIGLAPSNPGVGSRAQQTRTSATDRSITPPSNLVGETPRRTAVASEGVIASQSANSTTSQSVGAATANAPGAGASGGGSGGGGNPGAGGTSGGVEALGGISVAVDAPTNTILASGSRSALDELARLIERLDKRQSQVLLEVQLVSLSESEALDIGVELSTMFRDGSTRINLSSLFGLATGTDALPTGSGFTGLVVNPGDFQVLVRALEQVNRGKATSAPKVVVANNATSTLRSVNRQPFTSINASDTVATTSFGGTQDAGTTITVTPRIAEGDHLALEYSVELSAFVGEATTTADGGIIPPPSQQSSVQGEVTIPDGYTIALGGLRDLNEAKGTTRIPILGSLPLIGQLFRVDSTSESDARFFVFIKATVLRDPGFADLRALSAPDLAHAGVDDGEPTLMPIWMDGGISPAIDPHGDPPIEGDSR